MQAHAYNAAPTSNFRGHQRGRDFLKPRQQLVLAVTRFQRTETHACAGFGGVYCEGSQQAQLLGQQSHGFMEPGQWTYFTLTLDHKDPRWQGGLAVAFLTTNGGHPVVLQKYGGIPTLQDSDRVLR